MDNIKQQGESPGATWYIYQEEEKTFLKVQPIKKKASTITKKRRGPIEEKSVDYILEKLKDEKSTDYKKRQLYLKKLIKENKGKLPSKLPKNFKVEEVEIIKKYMGEISEKIKATINVDNGASITYPLYFDPLPHQIEQIINNLIN